MSNNLFILNNNQLLFYRYHKNQEHHRKNPTVQRMMEDLLDFNKSMEMMEDTNIESSNIVFEKENGINNHEEPTKTIEANQSINPQHVQNIVNIDINELHQLIAEKSALAAKNEMLEGQFKKCEYPPKLLLFIEYN